MDLVVECYRLCRLLPADERYLLSAQIRDAVVSVPTNIAEGHGRAGRGEYMNHLSMSRGSLMEVQTLLEIARRVGYLGDKELETAFGQWDSVSRMQTRLRKSLSRASPNSARGAARRCPDARR